MESKYLTKRKLIAVNNHARRRGGNHIDPEFLELLPDRFNFPACKASPIPTELGLVRCWVTIGADDPVDPGKPSPPAFGHARGSFRETAGFYRQNRQPNSYKKVTAPTLIFKTLGVRQP